MIDDESHFDGTFIEDNLHLAIVGSIRRRQLFPFQRTQLYATNPSPHLQEDKR